MAALALIVAGILAACAPRSTLPPNPTVAAPHAYSICPQSGELPPKDVNDEAVRILRERLSLLGVAEPAISVGACIEVALELTGQDPDAVQAAVLGTGRVELVPVPPDQVGNVQAGGIGPVGVEPLVSSIDLADAAIAAGQNGQPLLTLTMTEAGAGAFGSWTTAHLGGSVGLIVDGVVAAAPVINEPITGASVTLSVPEAPPVPLEAVRVMVETGPLPEAWTQPERPQG